MAAPTRPRNSNPFMATSPSPSAHRYLGLNVHDFNLTPAEYFLPSRSWRDQGRGLRQTHSNIRWCVIGTAETRMSAMGHKRTLVRGIRTVRFTPPKADVRRARSKVRYVPEADIAYSCEESGR